MNELFHICKTMMAFPVQKRIWLWLLLCCNVIGLNAQTEEGLLFKLDSLFDEIPVLLEHKEKNLQQLREKAGNKLGLEERFWLNKMFYDEYFSFSSDSALVYVNQNIQIAEQLNRPEWKNEWMVNRSFLLTASGLLKEAEEALSLVEVDCLSTEARIFYYRQKMYLYSHLGQYIGSQKEVNDLYYNEMKKANEDLLGLLSPSHPLYWWAEASFYEYNPTESLINGLTEVVETSQLSSYTDALNAYVLAVLYKNLQNEALQTRYLICSAIADIRMCNRDVASLEELAWILYAQGDIDRAYRYISYCQQAAQLYPNRVRMMNVSALLDRIHVYYQSQNAEQREYLHRYLYMVSFLSFILIIAVLFIYRQVKTLARSRSKLNETNEQLVSYIEEFSYAQKKLEKANAALQDLNQQLQQANDKLLEVNCVKEEYIGYVFSICSNYISKMDNLRKNINRKMKAGQFEDVMALTSSVVLTQNELKEFYQNFDSIFLRVYPNFVQDFNTLLRPEEQVVLKEGERLNTELRIYALVRLGINDSVKIAEFLHCSPQTVYNNRLRTRNKAIVPKDDFVERVQALGKYVI